MNPVQSVDHHLLPDCVTRRFFHSPAIAAGSKSSGSGSFHPDLTAQFELYEPGPTYPANQVGSLCTDGLHRPLFDYDHDTVEVGLWSVGALLDVPRRDLVAVSSTTNWHIYAPTRAFTWEELAVVLGDAMTVGVLNWGYVGLCLRDRGCYLRPPGQSWADTC